MDTASSASPYLAPAVDTTDIKPQNTAMRIASIDAYRGLVMVLMLAEVLELMTLATVYPNSAWAQWLRFHTTHVAWVGLSLHDMIQPSFSFLVGVSLPFSIAARHNRGKSFGSTLAHAVWRSVVLIALGILLRSLSYTHTNYTFDDTLTQIGLGYLFLFLLAHTARSVQIAATLLILVGYWALFAVWPLPPADFDWQTVGLANDWPYLLHGFEAHWNKHVNPAAAFDTWFMNLFPRETPYTFSSGGYCTLNFIPTLATMLLGVLAGGVLRNETATGWKLMRLLSVGAILLLAGWGLGAAGVCPIVKRIWTPSWVLVSGGICMLTLGLLYAVCDVRGWRGWAWPLLVVGANSITAYVMSWTMEGPIKAFLQRHLGREPFLIGGEAWEPVLLGAAVLMSMWLILLWLFRQRIFVRV